MSKSLASHGVSCLAVANLRLLGASPFPTSAKGSAAGMGMGGGQERGGTHRAASKLSDTMVVCAGLA
jgi:hypothetical protein